MQQNTMKATWDAGNATYGLWLSSPEAASAEAIGDSGFDYVCVDMQHGLIDYQDAVSLLRAIRTANTTPIVRVPWNEPGIIGKVLDAGALGVIIPMVNSVEEAEAAVRACRYAPEGSRSFGPIRAGLVYGADYFDNANTQVACIPMIETRQAIDALDDILAVPGIDAVYVGPADLHVSLGLPPGGDSDHAAFNDAIQKVVSSATARGITPGIHANPAIGAKRVAGGFRMVTISSDLAAMAAGVRRELRQVKDGVSGAGADGSGTDVSDGKRVY